MRRVSLILVLVFVANVLSGCTFIGMGIGAATPRWVPDDHPQPGAIVRATAGDGSTVEGTYDPKIGIASRNGSGYVLPVEQIRWMQRRSTRIWTGTAIGAVIDAVCVLATMTVLAVAKPEIGPTWESGSWGMSLGYHPRP